MGGKEVSNLETGPENQFNLSAQFSEAILSGKSQEFQPPAFRIKS